MSPFLKRCQCMRGFFTLRPCDQAATQTCARCQRMICEAHLSAAANAPLCLECAARDDEARTFDGDYDGAWLHRYRHHYYVDHGYRPSLHGGLSTPYYNDYDVRAFDQNAAEAANADDDDDAAGGGLGDS
jgi:hypothetical protein